MAGLKFDGYDLSTDFVCGDPELTVFNAEPNILKPSSSNGAVFVGMRYGTSRVSVTVAAEGTALERRNKFAELGSRLFVDEPKKLILPDAPDRYYMAVPDGGLELQRAYGAEYATLTFMLTDPIAASNTERHVSSTNGTAVCDVDGTAPTYMRFYATPASPESGTNLWGLALQSNTATDKFVVAMRYTMTSVTANMETKQASSSGYATMPTLDSVWIKLKPGTNTLTVVKGSGEFTVYWRDRWY